MTPINITETLVLQYRLIGKNRYIYVFEKMSPNQKGPFKVRQLYSNNAKDEINMIYINSSKNMGN